MQLAEGKTDLDAIPAPGAKRQAKSAETAADAAD
jgi:hypothetical protein